MVLIQSDGEIPNPLIDIHYGPLPFRKHRLSEKDLDRCLVVGNMPIVIIGREGLIYQMKFRHVLIGRIVIGDAEDFLCDRRQRDDRFTYNFRMLHVIEEQDQKFTSAAICGTMPFATEPAVGFVFPEIDISALFNMRYGFVHSLSHKKNPGAEKPQEQIEFV